MLHLELVVKVKVEMVEAFQLLLVVMVLLVVHLDFFLTVVEQVIHLIMVLVQAVEQVVEEIVEDLDFLEILLQQTQLNQAEQTLAVVVVALEQVLDILVIVAEELVV